MANLGPLYQNQTYGNLLQVDGGLTSELKPVLDGDGNASALSLSLTSVGVEGLVASAASNLYGGVPGVIPYQVAPDTTGFTAVGPAGYVLASAGAAQPVWTNTIQNSTYSNSTFDVFGGAAGQILYQVGPNDTSFTGAGESGQVLTSSGGGAPYWSSSIAFAGLANNAYNISGGTPGQLLYQSNVGETSKVATGTSGQLLVSNGIAAPSWNTITAADVGAVALDGSSVMTGDLWMNYNQVKGVGTPTSNNDAANKAYVDSVATGLKIKAACVAASTANVTLSGSATVDGVALNNLDRVLIKNQTDATTNGIYSVNTSGAWSRTTDADTWSELVGATVFITGGSVNINTTWACNISAGGNFGENITFVQFGASTTYTAGTGLTLTGSQFSLTTPVSVANGGSGVATLTGILKGNGTSAFSAATASDVVSLIGTTPVQNATSASTCSGNAATATILQTARAINGVSFNGSAGITITADTNYWCYFTAGGAGDASGSYFNGSAARNISYNTIGAAATDGSNASGTWPISINASNLVGTVAANKGGTGISSYAVGDMLVAASSTALGKLTVGSEGYVLAVYSGIPTWRPASSVLSLGTMATQNANAVAITGGSINGTSIGSTSAASGKFTSLTSTDNVDLSGFISVTAGNAAYLRYPRIWNPTDTYWYRITPSAISTNVYATLPALAGNDTFVFEGHTQTLTNKTINVDNNNTISGIAANSFVLSNSGGSIDGLAAQKAIPSGAVVGTTDTQILTNKSLTSPTINGGSITNITDLAIADGGTGASDAATARSNLGLAIGTNVQAYNAGLADIAGLAKTDNNIIVGNGTNWVAESGATARTSLGLGTVSTINTTGSTSTYLRGDGTWATPTTGSDLRLFNILDYGAVSGGSSSTNASAIQAAVAAANSAGGGVVFIPRGTYTINAPITVYSKISFIGEGPQISVIKRDAAYSAYYLFVTENFESYNTVPVASEPGAYTLATGPYEFAFKNFSIDGSRVTGSPACVAIFGCGYTINNFKIVNCAAGGFYSRYWVLGQAPQYNGTTNLDTQMEANISDFYISGSGAYPIFSGPHDSQINNMIVSMSMFGSSSNTNPCIYFGVGAQGSQVNNLHAWSPYSYYCVLIDGAYMSFDNIYADNCLTNGSLIVINTTSTTVNGKAAQDQGRNINVLQIGTASYSAACNVINLTTWSSQGTMTVVKSVSESSAGNTIMINASANSTGSLAAWSGYKSPNTVYGLFTKNNGTSGSVTASVIPW